MLDTQYRMHPAISAFPSHAFYNDDLKDGTVQSGGEVRPGFEPPITSFLVEDESGRRSNLTFVDHDYKETPQMRSIANHGDAEKVCDIVTDLLFNNPVSLGPLHSVTIR
jgi:superfamily I DNA and/or RNA helicase